MRASRSGTAIRFTEEREGRRGASSDGVRNFSGGGEQFAGSEVDVVCLREGCSSPRVGDGWRGRGFGDERLFVSSLRDDEIDDFTGS